MKNEKRKEKNKQMFFIVFQKMKNVFHFKIFHLFKNMKMFVSKTNDKNDMRYDQTNDKNDKNDRKKL